MQLPPKSPQTQTAESIAPTEIEAPPPAWSQDRQPSPSYESNLAEEPEIKQAEPGAAVEPEMKEREPGPVLEPEMKEPEPGPVVEAETRECEPGPEAAPKMKEPQPGPETEPRMKEPQPGPSAEPNMKEPQPGLKAEPKMESDSASKTADTGLQNVDIPVLGDQHAPQPPKHEPSLTPGAIDRRMRRVFTPHADGTCKVPQKFVDQWKQRGKARKSLEAIMASCGYSADMLDETKKS